MEKDLTIRETVSEVFRVFFYLALFTFGLVVFSSGTALLEGIGLSFIEPIFEVANSGGLSYSFRVL